MALVETVFLSGGAQPGVRRLLMAARVLSMKFGSTHPGHWVFAAIGKKIPRADFRKPLSG
jgi:hypothetical protein